METKSLTHSTGAGSAKLFTSHVHSTRRSGTIQARQHIGQDIAFPQYGTQYGSQTLKPPCLPSRQVLLLEQVNQAFVVGQAHE